MSSVLSAVQVILASVLVVAAVGKVLRAEEFATALRLTRLPESMIHGLGSLVVLVELVLAGAIMLASPRWMPVMLAVAILLFGVFTIWMLWVRSQRLRIRCGCFGTGSAVVGTATIARNLLLMLTASVGWWLATRTQSWLPGLSLPWLVTVTVGGVWLGLVTSFVAAWPELAITFDRLQAREAARS